MLTDMTKLTVALRKFGNAPRVLKILTIILPHAARVCNLSQTQTRLYRNPLQYTCTVFSSIPENLRCGGKEADYPF